MSIIDTALASLITAQNNFQQAIENKLSALKSTYLGKTETAADSNKLGGQTLSQVLASASGGGPEYVGLTHRYPAYSTPTKTIWITSSSNCKMNLSWSLSGTSLTITDAGHTRSVGDNILIYNTNLAFQACLVVSTTTDTFTVTSASSGTLSGTAAYYGVGFTGSFLVPLTGCVLTAPSNPTPDIQLISFRIHIGANTRSTTAFTIQMPTSGAGGNTSSDDLYLPFFWVRSDNDPLTAATNTVAKNSGGVLYNYQLAAMPATTAGLFIVGTL